MVDKVEELPTIKQLLKWHGVRFTALQAKVLIDRLRKFKAEISMESLIEWDGLVGALAITYGRMFTQSTGIAQLKASMFDGTGFEQVHANLMELRHERYAHHGKHDFIQYHQSVYEKDGDYVIKGQIAFAVDGSAFDAWKALVEFVEEYIDTKIFKFLEVAGKSIGTTVRFETEDEQAKEVRAEEYQIVHRE